MRKDILRTISCFTFVCSVIFVNVAFAEGDVISSTLTGVSNVGITGIRKAGEILNSGESVLSEAQNFLGGNNLSSQAQNLFKGAENVKKAAESLVSVDPPKWMEYFFGNGSPKIDTSFGDISSQMNAAKSMASNFSDRLGKVADTMKIWDAMEYGDTGITVLEHTIDMDASNYVGTALDAAKKAEQGLSQTKYGAQQAVERVKGLMQPLEQAQQTLSDFSEMKHNEIDVPDFQRMSQDLMKDSLQKAEDAITGKELVRVLNEEVLDAMSSQQNQVPQGGGVKTLDVANMTVGLLNLDSVFDTYHGNDSLRVSDYKMCGINGWEWEKCCQDAASVAASVEESQKIYQACCLASPTKNCKSKAENAADCLKKAENLEDGWTMCNIECGNKDYGELVHSKDEKLDNSQIEKLVKECYDYSEGNNYTPSPTVLTASELAAVVPEPIKEILQRN